MDSLKIIPLVLIELGFFVWFFGFWVFFVVFFVFVFLGPHMEVPRLAVKLVL